MNVKRYIHPRNKYKKPPDYRQLAITYPEFREIAIVDLAGKVRIDFRDKKSLRVLTETLLRHDFDLHVNIPPDNLNPAITLRVNYILWIEDLMEHSKLKMNEITGVDVGTGATCIYALLLAKIYGCHVIATEVDKKSAEYAEECVKGNDLCDLIKVILVNSDRIFKDAVEDDKYYDFSMCNPPFFESEGDYERVEKALPPRNASTGSKGELKVKGGEVAFVTKMIEESIEMRDRIKIYSTMIGRKADLFQLKSLMRSNNIENLTWTEFCQGHTTRWGLAWSFLPKSVLDLGTAPVIRKSGRKSMIGRFERDYKTVITFPVEGRFSCLDDLIGFLRTTMEELNIKLEEISIPEDSSDSWVCEITAIEKSWEHSRRKRRLMQRQLALKKQKSENSEFEANVDAGNTSSAILEESDDLGERFNSSSSSIESEKNAQSGSEERDKKPDERIPLLACTFCVEKGHTECEKEAFRIQMILGTGGTDALQSLRQYLINKLEVRNKILDSSSVSVKKRKKKTKRTGSIRQS